MLCIQTMTSGTTSPYLNHTVKMKDSRPKNTYLNTVNVDLNECVEWLLKTKSKCESDKKLGDSESLYDGNNSSNNSCSPHRRCHTSDHVILPAEARNLTVSRCKPADTTSELSLFSIGSENHKKYYNFLCQSLTHIPLQEQCKYLQSFIHNNKLLELCGFFYDFLDMQSSRHWLRDRTDGMFLVRCSSDPRYQYSLSVKTARGPTSVRIVYNQGKYHLDCESGYESRMPKFSTVLDLIQFYVKNSSANPKEKSQCYWLEQSGHKEVPVELSMPCRQNVSSLQHLCRRSIHRHCDTVDSNDLLTKVPTISLYRYLLEYPFWL